VYAVQFQVWGSGHGISHIVDVGCDALASFGVEVIGGLGRDPFFGDSCSIVEAQLKDWSSDQNSIKQYK
jgi:hypothetical protein